MTERAVGLHDPATERDACGIGFLADLGGNASHRLVEMAIEVLNNLTHRGACGSDPSTGDGAGITLQVPHEFLARECDRLGFALPEAGAYGVGQFFLPRDREARDACEQIVERVAFEEHARVLGWRDVPVDPSALGEVARRNRPEIRQAFFVCEAAAPGDALERRLYVLRRRIENEVAREAAASRGRESCASFYIPSLSSRTVVYKGLLLPSQFSAFYRDLADPAVATALVLVHQRFATNTFPSWRLAHPFRYLCHNGEINTIRGNVALMRAREGRLTSDLFGRDLAKLYPIIAEGQSDSACLDNAAEFLVQGGRDLAHAMMMLIPESWSGRPGVDLDRIGFFDYHHEIMGPWDGPAAVAFTDGRVAGACLDANGLRPLRWAVTRDGLVVCASEAGVLPIRAEDLKTLDRLRPGEMILADLREGRIRRDDEIKEHYARRRPYREWVSAHRVALADLPDPVHVPQPDHATLRQRQMVFGYTIEELRRVLTPMAVSGQEPTGSMGNDLPLAVLSRRPRLLFDYFRQLFAQVTNPPIDPIRERVVMALASHIGPEGNLLEEAPEHARRIRIQHPILTNRDLAKIRALGEVREGFRTHTLSALFRASEGPEGLEAALDRLCREASEAVAGGATYLIVSDRGIREEWAAIPSLLAVSAVHHHLIREHLRTEVGLIAETGEARQVHHFACLIGYGAGSVNPYLAFETLNDLVRDGYLPEWVDAETAEDKYTRAVHKGLLKVFARMGITSFRSYTGAQVFEALGLGRDLIERHFTGTASRLGGIGLREVAIETLARHETAYRRVPKAVRMLDLGGDYQVRTGGEVHAWNAEAVATLRRAVREDDPDAWRRFSEIVDRTNREAPMLRGLFTLREREPIPLDEVEPVSEIVRRFNTGAMSFGSISREAHEALAIAMNRLGGRSNTGEGGEEPERYHPDPDGSSRNSAIKQVASARFGVTAEYLVHAREIQIKIAQGAKPGEGGQLPGPKVDEAIARVRHSTPGVELISPPPHHDIYSIEDLAQLIHDLRCVNPEARVSVKLVAEVGVGTVAAGVAKAGADKITISGDCGGTGASPLTSIYHAGIPWELGLAETHQTLVANRLRDRVRLETDGGLRNGRDVIVAALLGADEFGFATAALVSLGCVMMRKCHLNTCPVGVATQDPILRARFDGRPEYVIRYFEFLAAEVRQWIARLGFRRLSDLVGRSDLLIPRVPDDHFKARHLDLSALLASAAPAAAPRLAGGTCGPPVRAEFEYDPLERELMRAAAPAIESARPVALEFGIRNVHRSIGAGLSGRIARAHDGQGLPDDTIRVRFVGSAGQSFGAFLARGVTFRLEGEANDYLGKGLCGGRIVVVPAPGAAFEAAEACLVGNVALYGATSGEVFIRGNAGERFAVRNSGATAVVEGVGDHGCEYMTGGTVVILGPIGRNFAAGMSGGRAFVLAQTGGAEPAGERQRQRMRAQMNLEMGDVHPVEDDADLRDLYDLVRRYFEATLSPRARAVLDSWPESARGFDVLIPTEYRRILEEREAGFGWMRQQALWEEGASGRSMEASGG